MKAIFALDEDNIIDDSLNLCKQMDKYSDLVKKGIIPVAIEEKNRLICIGVNDYENMMILVDSETEEVLSCSDEFCFIDIISTMFYEL